MRKKKKDTKIRNNTEIPKKKGTPRKKIIKIKVPKTRNAGTMTEAAFWSFIRSALRQKSRWWKPITLTKMAARRPYGGGVNKRQKFEYQCSACKNWFMEKEISVHHLVECGTLKCAEDLPGFVERLFCEKEFLTVLCDRCHDLETKNYLNLKKKQNEE